MIIGFKFAIGFCVGFMLFVFGLILLKKLISSFKQKIVKVKTLKKYIDKQIKKENFEEVSKLNILITDKLDDDLIKLPTEYTIKKNIRFIESDNGGFRIKTFTRIMKK